MQEKSLIKKNILEYIEYKCITKYEFYKLTGITRGILSQNNGISEDNIARFLAQFPEVDIQWLITGQGEMIKTGAHTSPSISSTPNNKYFELLEKYANLQEKYATLQEKYTQILEREQKKDAQHPGDAAKTAGH